MKDIVVFGGKTDPNIRSFCHYLENSSIDYLPCVYTVGAPLNISFDLNQNQLLIDGAELKVKAAFFRKDVFSYIGNNNKDPYLMQYSGVIHDLIKQYLLYNKHISIINRSFLMGGGATNKIYNLLKAKELGFLIPDTLISSNLTAIRTFTQTHDTIQKPVGGGDHARPLLPEQLERYSTDFPCPHKVQERLQHPEIRVYRIGSRFLSFHLKYSGLDYRTHQQVDIKLIENDKGLCSKLEKLANFLGLNYAAADFMANKQGDMTFLEINSFPMFARFDKASDYAVSKAIFECLLQKETQSQSTFEGRKELT